MNATSSQTQATPPTTTPIIGIIDDDAVFVSTLSRSLTRRSAQVYSVTDPTQWRTLPCDQLDVLLLDLNLDGSSGLKLLEEILAEKPKLRIIMLTAYASIATTVDAIKRGADNYLCKPIVANDILNLVYCYADSNANPNTAASVTHDNGAPADTVTDNTTLSVNRLEWEHIQRVLMENNGNISATARALNMHRRTLQRKLQKKPAQ